MISLIPVFAQSYYSTSYIEGTVTRSNDAGNKRMHYVKTGTTSGYFLSDFVVNGPYFGSHSVSGYKVNDFTIFNDTVYFCGEDANGVGFYGWTSTVNDQIFNWTFHVYKLYDNASTFVTDVRRIRVFRSGADLNVLLVGLYKGGGSDTYSSLIHVKNNDTCTLAYLYSDYFDDVAIVKDYVVTIERKGGVRTPYNDGHQMRVLNKNQFSLYDALFDYYYALWQIQSVGRLWLQAANNNRFFSVYRDGVGFYFNTYSVASGNLTCYNYFSIATSIMPTIGDVAYNDYDKTLAILYNIDTVGTAAIFDCASFHTISLSSALYPTFYMQGCQNPVAKLLSITKQPSSPNFYVTAVCDNKPLFWNLGVSNCDLSRQISVTSGSTNVDRYLWATNRAYVGVSHLTFSSSSGFYNVGDGCWTLFSEQEESNETGDE